MTIIDNDRDLAELRLDTASCDHTTRLTVTGELDLATAAAFLAAGEDAVLTEMTTCLELDLSGVSFMDAAGVGALVALNRQARLRGRLLVLVAASQPVRKVLELTRLANAFQADDHRN
jgi:anti-sigma B factor antagonist